MAAQLRRSRPRPHARPRPRRAEDAASRPHGRQAITPSSARRCRSSARNCARRWISRPDQRCLMSPPATAWPPRRGAALVRRHLDRLRAGAAGARPGARRGRRHGRSNSGRPTRRTCRSTTTVLTRALHLRRDVHAEPGPRGRRVDARLQAEGQDRPGELDAGRFYRPGVQDARQTSAAARRRQIAGAVGHRARG